MSLIKKECDATTITNKPVSTPLAQALNNKNTKQLEENSKNNILKDNIIKQNIKTIIENDKIIRKLLKLKINNMLLESLNKNDIDDTSINQEQPQPKYFCQPILEQCCSDDPKFKENLKKRKEKQLLKQLELYNQQIQHFIETNNKNTAELEENIRPIINQDNDNKFFAKKFHNDLQILNILNNVEKNNHNIEALKKTHNKLIEILQSNCYINQENIKNQQTMQNDTVKDYYTKITNNLLLYIKEFYNKNNDNALYELLNDYIDQEDLINCLSNEENISNYKKRLINDNYTNVRFYEFLFSLLLMTKNCCFILQDRQNTNTQLLIGILFIIIQKLLIQYKKEIAQDLKMTEEKITNLFGSNRRFLALPNYTETNTITNTVITNMQRIFALIEIIKDNKQKEAEKKQKQINNTEKEQLNLNMVQEIQNNNGGCLCCN